MKDIEKYIIWARRINLARSESDMLLLLSTYYPTGLEAFEIMDKLGIRVSAFNFTRSSLVERGYLIKKKVRRKQIFMLSRPLEEMIE